MNLALRRFLQFCTVPLIILPYFFFKSVFCRDGIHFSFYGNHLFTLYLNSVISFCNEFYEVFLNPYQLATLGEQPPSDTVRYSIPLL